MSTPLQEDIDFLEHYGVKGQQWGVRKKTTGAERKAGRQEVRRVAKEAGDLIVSSRRTSDPSQRKAIAKDYEKLLKEVQSDAWKKSYQDASTMGKGEKAAHILLFGPLAAITIKQSKRAYETNQVSGYAAELNAGRAILKEMKSA